MPSGSLVYDPSQLAGLNSGANMSGGMTPAPMTSIGSTIGIGGNGNPLVPSTPSGQSVNPTAMPAYNSPYGNTNALTGLDPSAFSGTVAGTNAFGMPMNVAQQNDLATSFQHAGFKGGIGTAMSEFLMSGAGFNPAVAQAMVASLQPQFAQNQANLMGQFGAQGLAGGSPAALGMAALGSQETLDVGSILSGMYEQSVQNYMNMLTQGKSYVGPPEWEQALNAVLSGGRSVICGGGLLDRCS